MNDLTMMLAIHDAFRRDLRRLGAALRADDAPARAGALLERWDWIADQLHHHHAGEDRWLWPALREHVAARPAAATVLAEMEREHLRLDPLQRAADAALRAFAADPGPARAAATAAALEPFATLVEQHLGHEVRDAVPLLERELPAAALRTYSARQQRSMGLRPAMTRFFPWLLDEAPPERSHRVLGELPRPLRVVVRRSLPSYARAVAPAWG